MPLLVIEEPDSRSAAVKAVDREDRLNERPTAVTVGRIAAKKQERPGGHQGEQFMMLTRKVSAANIGAKIPECFPV